MGPIGVGSFWSRFLNYWQNGTNGPVLFGSGTKRTGPFVPFCQKERKKKICTKILE